MEVHHDGAMKDAEGAGGEGPTEKEDEVANVGPTYAVSDAEERQGRRGGSRLVFFSC